MKIKLSQHEGHKPACCHRFQYLVCKTKLKQSRIPNRDIWTDKKLGQSTNVLDTSFR